MAIATVEDYQQRAAEYLHSAHATNDPTNKARDDRLLLSVSGQICVIASSLSAPSEKPK